MRTSAPPLELHEDDRFQRVDWAVQRWSAVVFGVLMLGAGLGLFGGGPLSRAEARRGDVRVEYGRIVRCNGPAKLVAEAGEGGLVTLELSGGMFESARIERVWPEPRACVPLRDGVRMSFAETGEGAPRRVVVRYTPQQAGSFEGTVNAGGTRIAVSSVVCP